MEKLRLNVFYVFILPSFLSFFFLVCPHVVQAQSSKNGLYVSMHESNAFPGKKNVPAATSISLQGEAPSPVATFRHAERVEGHLKDAQGLVAEVGYKFRAGQGGVMVGIEFNRRGSFSLLSDFEVIQSKMILDGLGLVSEGGHTRLDTQIKSHAVLAKVQYVFGENCTACNKLLPWIGVGLGGSQLNVRDYELMFEASHQKVAPGLIENFLIEDGSLDVQEQTSQSLTWEIAAGIKIPITSQWVVDIGYKRVGLGSYRLFSEKNPAQITRLETETELIVIDRSAAKQKMFLHEPVIGLMYTF